ncbi:MAG: FAD-binding protein [Armatimonadetes bacterium]|jgi:glycolate oxidase|nr:FAD-binding protein [Armatimonadota bacterium]
MNAELLNELTALLPKDGILTNPAERLVYDCDAYTVEKSPPDIVVLPTTTAEVSAIVKACNRHDTPFLARGAGTGLSGGAIALADTVVICLSRMNRILGVDAHNRTARVQAGVVNNAVSRQVASLNLHFAPDPGSQTSSTIGGNIAENAGGPHTLKYGVTTHNTLAVQFVTSDGEIVEIGSDVEGLPGYDLVSLICGSEGTFGIVTEATVRLTPLPQSWRTLLAVFNTLDDATNAVSAIINEGVIPAALEMIDATVLESVEAAYNLGFPLDAAAVLLVEIDGLDAGLDAAEAKCRAACQRHHARSVESARDEEERDALWTARRKGVGTLGRIARSMVTQDCVIPRSRLPEVLREIGAIVSRYGLRVANIFHAGDGNLHPIILFDERVPDEVERMTAANHEIVTLCLKMGGSLTGEHGIGLEKQDYMALMFGEDDLDMMIRVHKALDPDDLVNPGKFFPGSKKEFRETPESITPRRTALV